AMWGLPPFALLKMVRILPCPRKSENSTGMLLASRNQEGAKQWLGFRFGFRTSLRIGADRAHSLVDAWEYYGKSRSFSGLTDHLYRATEYLREGFDNVQP